MTITNDAIDNDRDIVIVPEAQMEEATTRDDDDVPAATAVIAEAVEPSGAQDAKTHALTESNMSVPVVVVSALLPDRVGSSIEQGDVRPDLLSATVYKHSRDPRLELHYWTQQTSVLRSNESILRDCLFLLDLRLVINL